MILKNIAYFTLLALLCPLSALAQKWEFGVQAGMAGYMGDFNQENIFQFNDWAVGASAKYNLNPTWGLRLNLSQVNVQGDDADSKYIFEQERGEDFSTSLTEMAVLADFNFFKFQPDFKKNQWTPYLSAGLGVVLKDEVVNVLRYGAGFKYNIKDAWSVGGELAYRTLFSLAKEKDPLDVSLDPVVDMKRADAYMTLQFTLIYTLFCKTCPRW